MGAALALARRGLGTTWPNPAVGCVLVRADLGGRVVGRGWTQPGGRPHAETEALRRAGALARGARAYVTLEPCSHHGKTPPCAEALIAAGVGRVVCALEDPDPRVSGGGFARLRAAGITVETGLMAAEARDVNAGFLMRLAAGRPLFTLKAAASLDGRIATAAGESRWITGAEARARGHLLRATHEAILVGSGTVLADDPALDCRLPGLAGRAPLVVVADTRLRTPPAARLFEAVPGRRVLILAGPEADDRAAAALRARGAEILTPGTDPAERRIDLAAAARTLGALGLTRVLVEGGGTLAAALLRAGLADRLVWFRAPLLLGGEGRPAVGPLALERLAQAPRACRTAVAELGDDLMENFNITLQEAE